MNCPALPDDFAAHFPGPDRRLFIRLRSFVAEREREPAQLLHNDQIYMASVSQQDDIFEGRPRYVWSTRPSLDEIARLVERQLPNLDAAEQQAEAVELQARIEDDHVFGRMMSELEAHVDALYVTSSILSLFRSHNSQRNWSDYADRGRGYGVVFDFDVPWHLQRVVGWPVGRAVPFPVNYTDVRPVVQVKLGPVDADQQWLETERALLTKSAEWGNQQEARLIRVGVGPGLVEFPTTSLKAVILGYDVGQRNRDHILDLVRRRQHAVPVFQLTPTRDHYSLACRLVNA